MFVVVLLLGGIGVALIRRYHRTAPAAPAGGGDAPARLLGWATGLLAADRAEWGHAIVGLLR